jgi:hypothetical protein
MAGIFKRIYDWLLSLFWYAVSLYPLLTMFRILLLPASLISA